MEYRRCIVSLMLCCLAADPALAGGACVVAKKMGNSLAIEWIAQAGVSAEQAILEAKRLLKQKGHGQDRYEDLFPQANSELQHAYFILVQSEYPNARGTLRTSYGCGFSDRNAVEAEWAALRDLQSYSWGWVPSKGYEVVERIRY